MFWTNNYVSSPHIEALLNKEDVTLQEIMDEEDILQECKSQNKKLVEYLTRPDVMDELVSLITKEPSTDMEEHVRYKYPNVACELLTCDAPTLNEKLAGDPALLAKLYSFIDTDQPLNPLLASFFSKTVAVLVVRLSEQNWYSYQFTCLQVLEFLKSRQTCVDLLLQHLETSAIMDLVLKLVTQVGGRDMRKNILSWLDSQQLVQRLVMTLSPSSDPAKHTNAEQLLCDMINITRDNQRTSTEPNPDPDPILIALESEETVCLLLDTILTGEKVESSIVGGIEVLLALLGQKANNVVNEGDFHGNGTSEEVTDNEQRIRISNATLLYMDQLHNLLLDPPYKPPVKTTVGVLECPLGITRLHVAKLINALLTTENVRIYQSLVELGTFETLLDLFFKYTWNNFLHTQVQLCLALAVNCDFTDMNTIIYANIFIKCRLIERITEAWDKNESKQNEEVDVKQNKEKTFRQGYMGHLINIANNIVSQCLRSDMLDNYLKTNLSTEVLRNWQKLVNTQLGKINKVHQMLLGGPAQLYLSSSDGNPDEYNSYSQEEYLQQMYSNYQGQKMAPQFIENFGYRDDDFNDDDDALHNSIDRLTSLAFTLSEEDLDKKEGIFNKICQQKQKMGPDECSARVEWGDEGELTFQTVVEKLEWTTKQQQNDSNSSDEDDEDPRDMHMDIDSSDTWDTAEPLPANTALPEVNPWGVASSEPLESANWANFDNFESTLSIETTVIIEKKPNEEVKKETLDTMTDVNETGAVLENKVAVEILGGGDAKIGGDTVGSTSSAKTEPDLDNKSTESTLYTVCVADRNANPSAVGERDTDCGEETKNLEVVKSTIENEKTSSGDNISCSLQNVVPETLLSPPKDTK